MKNLLLIKTFAILEAVVSSPDPVPLKELLDRLGLTPSTASRIAADLTEAGLIEKVGYRCFVPSLGAIVMGSAAVRHFPFLAAAAPLIGRRAAGLGVSGALHSMWRNRLVVLYRSKNGNAEEEFLPMAESVRHSDAAAMLLAQDTADENAALSSWHNCIRAESDAAADAGDDDFFRRRYAEATASGRLIRRDVGRRWSITYPVKSGGRNYALSFFGVNPERYNFDSLILECSLLVGKLRLL